jgi:hypothetical protein
VFAHRRNTIACHLRSFSTFSPSHCWSLLFPSCVRGQSFQSGPFGLLVWGQEQQGLVKHSIFFECAVICCIRSLIDSVSLSSSSSLVSFFSAEVGRRWAKLEWRGRRCGVSWILWRVRVWCDHWLRKGQVIIIFYIPVVSDLCDVTVCSGRWIRANYESIRWQICRSFVFSWKEEVCCLEGLG